MQQHYFHQSFHHLSSHKNIHPFRISAIPFPIKSTKSINQLPENNRFMIMSNGNAVEIYKLSPENVDFFMRKQFFCNIAKLQVIPSLHHQSDYVFILDQLGRYALWRPGQDQKDASNIILKQTSQTNNIYYREEQAPQQQQKFSGSIWKFDVKDTVGCIFFTVQNKLTLLNITVKAKEGLRITNIRTYQIPYTRFRYVNCLNIPSAKQNQFYVGIIQELQEKTILKIHCLQPDVSSTMIDQDSLSYKIEKINLLSFSSGENDEIIVLTYDEISIFKYKHTQYICNYRTRGNYGSVCYIDITKANRHFLKEATYVHLGQQMTVFTKHRLANYGLLKHQGRNILEGSGIVESKYLGHLITGQIMISFVTNFNEVYFIILAENRWRLVRRIQSLSSIFSLSPISNIQNPESLVCVHSSLQGWSQVTVLQVTSPTIVQQEQTFPSQVIQNIFSIQNGQSLIVCCEQENTLLSWQQQERKWISHYEFQNKREHVLACQGEFVVMTSGVYKYQATQVALTLKHVFKQANILSAVSNKNVVGYYTSQGIYKFYEFSSQSVSRIRKNCTEQYLWHMLENKNYLVSAAYNQIGQLRILPLEKVARKIQLKTQALVSSINSINYIGKNGVKSQKMIDQSNEEFLMVDLIIGFHNGDVEVYSLQKDKTIAKFNLGPQMVQIVEYRSTHLIVYTASKQYILSKSTQGSSEYFLSQIQLSSPNMRLSKILYLSKFDKFIVSLSSLSTGASTIQVRCLKLHKKLSDNELTLQLQSAISTRTLFRTQGGEQVPYVQIVSDRHAYVALSQKLMKYDLRTGEILKKQLHLLKQIVGVDRTEKGLLVLGVDFLDSGSVILFDYEDLNIKATYSLGKNQPSCIKSLKTAPYNNRFFVRYQKYLSLLQVEPTLLISQMKTINTQTTGDSIDINEQFNKIMLTDPYRYISVWDYDLQISSFDILPVSKYFGAHLVNDCCWLGGSLVTGDRGGKITIMQFNFGAVSDLNKINMTRVGEIYLGEEVFTVKRVDEQRISSIEGQNKSKVLNETNSLNMSSSIYYGTASGTVGEVSTIDQQQFSLLKQIQLDTIQLIDSRERFSYEQWRGRIVKDDKLIDASVIAHYLQQFRFKVRINQEQFYNQVKKVYEKLVIGKSRYE